MPLGISERLIEKAYGPQDFSYIYKKLDAASQKFAAEDAARKQYALKQYQTELSTFNKDRQGVREKDIAPIAEKYNRWATIEKQLSTSPNLINKDPKLYGNLKAESNRLYSDAQTHIAGSKALKVKEIKDLEDMYDPSKRDSFYDNAGSDYKKNVLDNSWDVVSQNNYDDKAKYFEQSISGKDFFDSISTKMPTALKKYEVPDLSFKGAPGEKRFISYESMPNISKIHDIVDLSLSSKLDRKADKFVNQEVKKLATSDEFGKVKSQWDWFYDEKNPNGYRKYNLPSEKPKMLDDTKTPKELFINYHTVKEFLSNLPLDGKLGKGEFYSESEEARYRSQLQKAASRDLLILKKSMDDKGNVVEIPDYTPSFERISKGGEEGVQSTKDMVNSFNNLEGSSATIYPIIASGKYKNNPLFKTGNDIVKGIAGQKQFEVEDVVSEKGNQKLQDITDKVNEHNKSLGFPDTDVTPGSLRSGKALVYYVDKDNYVILDAQGAASRQFLNKKVRASQLAAKGVREQMTKKVSAANQGIDPNDPMGVMNQ